MCSIPKDEYRCRFESLQARVRASGLDAFLVSAFDSIFYLTGAGFEPLERPFFLIVRPEGRPTLLVPKLDHQHMTKAHNVREADIHTYREYPAPSGSTWQDRLNDCLGQSRSIGIEPTLRMEIAQVLSDRAIRVLPLVEELRLIKSEAEIAMIRQAARYADLGVRRLLAASYDGATVAEGFAQSRNVSASIIREVDHWDPVTTKVLMATWASPRSAMPHSIPELNDRLGTGAHVALVLTRVNGYAAESERTFFTATPTAEMRNAFQAMLEARALALNLVRPGASCSELDGRVNDFLRQRGIAGEDRRLHRTGHGIGLGNHEGPWLAEGSDDRLAENMVVSIEPGIYLDQLGGYRHSDTVRVTRDGYELLTDLPIDLETLTLRRWKPLTRLSGQLVRSKLKLGRMICPE